MKVKESNFLEASNSMLEEAANILRHYRPVIIRRVLAIDKESAPELYEDEWAWAQAVDYLLEELAEHGY